MRITCVIHSLAGGGAERVMAGLSSRLSERGHSVTLITLDSGAQDRHTVSPAVRRIYLRLLRPSRGLVSALMDNALRWIRLRRAIRSAQPDVVLSFCDRTNVLTLLSSIGLPAPVVVSERNDPAEEPLPWVWDWLRTKTYRRAFDVIVLTQNAAQTVAAWSKKRPVVIPSAVDIPPIQVEAKGPASKTTLRKSIVAVGRLEMQKGFDLLLEAFAQIAEKNPDWDLVIYGEGSLRGQIEGLRGRLGLDDRVKLPGWARPIWPSLTSGDLFVLSSRYEGFPSVLLEAMAVGLPCVAFDCPSGPADIIRDGEDGLLVPSSDTLALANALQRCIDDPALRLRLGRQASRVTERFGWSAMVDAYENILRNAGYNG